MSWSALFDSTHIVKGVPVDADIELQCRLCRTYFYTSNAYYIGYSNLNYLKPEDEGKCGHNLKNLKPTGNWFVRRDIQKGPRTGPGFHFSTTAISLRGSRLTGTLNWNAE